MQKLEQSYKRELADTFRMQQFHMYGSRVKNVIKVLSNMMVDIAHYVDCDPEEVGVTEVVYYPVLEKILEENDECRRH